jgi:hypothetical protein
MIQGVDYSTARPDPYHLSLAGYRFAARYVGIGGMSKRLTPGEAMTLANAGLSIVAVCEGLSEGWMRGGRPAGREAASAALLEATQCGMPSGRPIYFACDFDVSAVQWYQVVECLRGAAEILGVGAVGIYGGRRAITWAMRDRAASWYWQTYAWSDGIWLDGVHIVQYHNGYDFEGSDVDLNRSGVADYGQWRPTTMIGGSTVDLEDVLTALADGTTKAGSLADRYPGVWDHLRGRTLSDIETRLSDVDDAADTVSSLVAIVTDLKEQVRLLVDKPAAVVDADAFFAAAAPRLTEIVETAVARTVGTVRNPPEDDQTSAAPFPTADVDGEPGT